MQCLDAQFELTGPAGARQVAARAFYRGACVLSRCVRDGTRRGRGAHAHPRPSSPSGLGYAYEKLKRKIGDGDATEAAAVALSLAEGRCAAASIAMTNLADRPIWSPEAGAALVGTNLGAAAVDAAVAAMQAAIEPGKDNRGPVEFKRHTAGVMLRRALARATTRAQAGGRAGARCTSS